MLTLKRLLLATMAVCIVTGAVTKALAQRARDTPKRGDWVIAVDVNVHPEPIVWTVRTFKSQSECATALISLPAFLDDQKDFIESEKKAHAGEDLVFEFSCMQIPEPGDPA